MHGGEITHSSISSSHNRPVHPVKWWNKENIVNVRTCMPRNIHLLDTDKRKRSLVLRRTLRNFYKSYHCRPKHRFHNNHLIKNSLTSSVSVKKWSAWGESFTWISIRTLTYKSIVIEAGTIVETRLIRTLAILLFAIYSCKYCTWIYCNKYTCDKMNCNN